jgi:hypothetical protein
LTVGAAAGGDGRAGIVVGDDALPFLARKAELSRRSNSAAGAFMPYALGGVAMSGGIARRSGATDLIRILAVASLLAAPFSSQVAAQEETGPPASNGVPSADELQKQEQWRIDIAQVPLPVEGCFEATFPQQEWSEVKCVTAPDIPMVPKHGPQPLTVGNGHNASAEAPSGTITTAIGTFESVTNVTSIGSPLGNVGPPVANAYTLQMNTNFFSTAACSGAADPTQCFGWEQFVYENPGSSGDGHAFIQYWLIRYNKPCPIAQFWNQFQFTGSTDIYCWKNSSGGKVAVPNQSITNLGQLSLTGTADASGDKVVMFVGATAYTKSGNSIVDTTAGWKIAEFGVFGFGGSSAGGATATFNSGAAITVRTQIVYGGVTKPNCVAQGFTGETSNLSFGPSAPAGSPPSPALIVRQSTAGGAASNCAAATTVGDTHLATFDGLFYDFQASGDFVLAQVDPDFVVQARQVSGAPTWPNASVNTAVAARMGKDQIAICLGRAELNINGEVTELKDGLSVSTPGGVDVWRTGNVYTVIDLNGNALRAEVNPTWINASVGLGRWPTKVVGLLANPDSDVKLLASRDGEVLENPFPFEEFYYRYGDSWRVDPSETLLSPCGEEPERRNPDRTFYARDLEPEVQERAREQCARAGVEVEVMLDACTLDTAVIENEAAPQVFVNAPEPVLVGEIAQ